MGRYSHIACGLGLGTLWWPYTVYYRRRTLCGQSLDLGRRRRTLIYYVCMYVCHVGKKLRRGRGGPRRWRRESIESMYVCTYICKRKNLTHSLSSLSLSLSPHTQGLPIQPMKLLFMTGSLWVFSLSLSLCLSVSLVSLQTKQMKSCHPLDYLKVYSNSSTGISSLSE